MKLPRPGVVGVFVRLVLGLAVATMAYDALRYAPDYWNGLERLRDYAVRFAMLLLLTNWVVNELTRKSWGIRPTLFLVIGAMTAIAVGAARGEPFGTVFGTYMWAWMLSFSLLLAPAFLLAAALRTPGCEMRSYAHLRSLVRGGDPNAIVCPGWIDRFDRIRLFGRW